MNGWPDNGMIEAAFGIIANVDLGDWSRQRPEWQEAAERWRDAYVRQARPADDRPFVEWLDSKPNASTLANR